MTINDRDRRDNNRPRPLSTLLPGLTGTVFGRKNALFGKLIAEWPAVAGEDIAAKTLPLDLKATSRKQGANAQAVLHLAVHPAFALELGYQKMILLERINMFFGYPAVKDIKTIQSSNFMTKKIAQKPFRRALDLTEERKVDDLVAGIKENDLQTALKNLGKAIISRSD